MNARPYTFNILIEIVSHNKGTVHRNAFRPVNTLLRDFFPRYESRRLGDSGEIETAENQLEPVLSTAHSPLSTNKAFIQPTSIASAIGSRRLCLHEIHQDLVEQVSRELGMKLWIGIKLTKANLIFTLRSRQHDSALRRLVYLTGDRYLQ